MKQVYVGEEEDNARIAYDQREHAFMNCQAGVFDDSYHVAGEVNTLWSEHK